MEVKFREAVFGDIPNLIELCNECFGENTNLDRAQQLFLKTIGDDTQIYLVGECNGEIVAHSKITIVYTMYEKTDVFSLLSHVCVKESYRSLGIATKLLEECERISKIKECTEIRLWSSNFRKVAHTCYKKCGYIEADAHCFYKKINCVEVFL